MVGAKTPKTGQSPENSKNAMSPSFLKAKNELSNFQQKIEDLDKYDSISEVKCRCPEKNCIYVAPLRTLTTHLARVLKNKLKFQKSFSKNCEIFEYLKKKEI